MKRKQNFQPIAWFWDFYKRALLDLDPPYQRRSVWNQAFKDYFIDTILLDYPAPAIFLYEEISPDGRQRFYVVDGKQRLTSIFEFAENLFPVSDSAQRAELRGKFFSDFDDETKKAFWGFQFSVEYLPTVEDGVISSIFDRINRNTKRLSAQELRHAKFDGEFIQEAERLTEWMYNVLPGGFPNIAASSRRQMKDVEFVADLLLLLDVGPKGYSTDALDTAFSDRDLDWERRAVVAAEFEVTTQSILALVSPDGAENIRSTRLRNQTDFYSLFGAIAELSREAALPPIPEVAGRLLAFVSAVDQAELRQTGSAFFDYYEAARSASVNTAQRKVRIDILKSVILRGVEGL